MSLLGDDLFSSGNNADEIDFDRAVSAFPDISLDGSTDIPTFDVAPSFTGGGQINRSTSGFSFDDFDTAPSSAVKVTGDDVIEKFENEFPDISVPDQVSCFFFPFSNFGTSQELNRFLYSRLLLLRRLHLNLNRRHCPLLPFSLKPSRKTNQRSSGMSFLSFSLSMFLISTHKTMAWKAKRGDWSSWRSLHTTPRRYCRHRWTRYRRILRRLREKEGKKHSRQQVSVFIKKHLVTFHLTFLSSEIPKENFWQKCRTPCP